MRMPVRHALALLAAGGLLGGLLLSAPIALADGASSTYLVLYKSQAVPADALVDEIGRRVGKRQRVPAQPVRRRCRLVARRGADEPVIEPAEFRVHR